MPRDNNPADIKVGSGKQVPGEATLTLGGAGMAGVGPNIGDVEGGGPFAPGGGGTAALTAHVQSGKAHSASSIYTEEGPSTLTSKHVEGELDELAGALPPEPPKFGYLHTHLTFTGLPDWGVLKMRDSPLHETVSGISSTNDAANIAPYYYATPTPTQDAEFLVRGHDPESDVTFNSGISTPDLGEASAGGYTRPPAGPGPVPVMRTTAILGRAAAARAIQVSGSVYPADRGVLALMHWPAGGNVAAFQAQGLLDRCVAALLMGHGILGKGPCADGKCDGGIGGIFAPGEDANVEYDPFSYPGQASGQYDLREIATGVSALDGSPLKSPWDDKDLDAAPGWKRFTGTAVPGPGQVRLGTDPVADNGTGFAPVQAYGIPILGGDEECYDDGVGSPPAGPLGNAVIGDVRENYFRYRLPYLDDYTQATGLKWTPGGVAGTEVTAKEKSRYFDVPVVKATGVTELSQAGDYTDFPGDNYTWQVARYRFQFNLKYTGLVTDFEEHGTYFFVHFKREKDFEAFVRDGIMPDDATNGYEVYSSWLAPTTAIEDTENRVNEETLTTVFAPAGPAPTYGYKAMPYHTMRVNVFEDPLGFQVAPGDVSLATSTFTGVDTMLVSGVTYYIPRDQATGNSSANLSLNVTVADFWKFSYRTDDRLLSGALGDTAPALLSSPNPAFIGLGPFTSGTGYTSSVGAAGSFYTVSTFFNRSQRIEIPFTHLDGAGAFTDADGPLAADGLLVAGAVFPAIAFDGDANPVFTSDAQPRVYLRLPGGNTQSNPDEGIQPANAGTGQGPGVATVDTGGVLILFHSTSFDDVAKGGSYANFRSAGVAPQIGHPLQTSAVKDDFEPFLDEVYRYADAAGGVGPGASLDALYGAGANTAIDGPGMGAWVGGPIETSVQVGIVPNPSIWQAVSWLQNDLHTATLVGATFLQIAGLPDRNPNLQHGQIVPAPVAGLCMYPHKNYAAGYAPVGPNYSAETGIKTYTRVLDVGASNASQPFVTLRIDGLQLQDFAYFPGNVGSVAGVEGIAILVKVPGLTSWMDIGRVDGSGPSKQDAVLDGAGCQVVGPATFDTVDAFTSHVYCEVKIHVGGAANLYAMTGLHGTSGIDAADVGKVPLLVQVRMDAQAVDFNLEEFYTPSTQTFSGTPVPEASGENVRGLLGIRTV